jgi:hypothetical protein
VFIPDPDYCLPLPRKGMTSLELTLSIAAHEDIERIERKRLLLFRGALNASLDQIFVRNSVILTKRSVLTTFW